MKRYTYRLMFAFVLAASARIAMAQDFPVQPFRFITAYPPGTSPDLIVRAVGRVITATMGQPVVVDNRPGAGGVTAVQELVKARPDGYTLMMVDTAQWAIYPVLRPGVYDSQRDMAPVSLVNTGAFFLVVQDSFPARNLQEFIAHVRGNPGKYSYGSSGIGTGHHLAMEGFKAALGLNIAHIPYKGSRESSTAILGGQVPMIMAGLSSVSEQLKGKLRLIAVTTAKRSRFAPDIPAMAEARPGLGELDFRAEQGFFAPANTPRTLIAKLSDAMQKVVQSPEVVQRIEAIGLEPMSTTPDRLAELVRTDIAIYTKAVKSSGATAD